MPIEKICQHCKASFKVSPRRHELVKFCSRACGYESKWETLKCDCCNISFKRKKSNIRGSVKNYCSTDCDRKSRLGRKHKEDPNAVKYFRTCETCAKEFQVTKTRSETARFCSIKCKATNAEYMKQCSEQQLREKSWRWTGGLYLNKTGYTLTRGRRGEREFEHRVVIFNEIMRLEPNHPFIVEQDGIKKLDSKIEVHHIDRNRSNNAVDNLLAVTKYAHSQIHHRNRKPDQWECWPSNPAKW